MLLAIDAGNTNTVFALFDGAVPKGLWRMATRADHTSDEYAAFLRSMMAASGLEPSLVHAAILGSVVPDANFHLTRCCRQHFHCDPMIVRYGAVDLGLKSKLPRPEEVGADRLINAVAGKEAYQPPLLIIDFGTATTFDVVDADGDYCGGAISPGINLSLQALHMAAAKLPRIAVARPERVIGTGTVPAIQSGVFWGYVGLIEGLISRIRAEYEETQRQAEETPLPMTVIATGGLASLFREAIPSIAHIDQDLTLRGLRLIHERNKKTSACVAA